jgi:hypothetical protein
VKILQLHRIANLRWLLWLVLSQAHEDLDEKQVGRIIDVSNMTEAKVAVVWSFSAGVPAGDEQSEGTEEEPQKDPLEAPVEES